MHVKTCGDESFTMEENLLHVHGNNVLCDMYSNTGIFNKLSYLFLRYRKSFFKIHVKILKSVWGCSGRKFTARACEQRVL